MTAYSAQCHLMMAEVKAGMKLQNENLLADDETWRAILEPALCQDSAAVETLARLLFRLKKAIEDGPDGANCAVKALSDGIEFIYPYTKAHQAALRLYILSLEGNLKPHDEPLNLINAAIERGRGQNPLALTQLRMERGCQPSRPTTRRVVSSLAGTLMRKRSRSESRCVPRCAGSGEEAARREAATPSVS